MSNGTNDNDTNDSKPALALVTNIKDAPKRQPNKIEECELEASPPQAILIQGDDWHVTACDGEQTYMWLVRKKTKRSKAYTIVEMYPGLTKKRMDLRDAKDPVDLEMTPNPDLKTIGDVLEVLEEIVFENLIEDDDAEADPAN